MIFRTYAINSQWDHVEFLRMVSRGRHKGLAVVRIPGTRRQHKLPVAKLYCADGCGRSLAGAQFKKGVNGSWTLATA